MDARCGQGRFLASVMSHRATCTRCRCQLDLENPAFLWNAEQHATKCNQADAAGFVQKPLEFFGVGPGAQPMLQAVSSLVAVDHSTLCHGYWPRDVRYKGRIYDTAVLLEQWRDGEAWYINRGFTATLCYEATPGATPICPVGSIVVWSNFSGATTVRMEGKVTILSILALFIPFTSSIRVFCPPGKFWSIQRGRPISSGSCAGCTP